MSIEPWLFRYAPHNHYLWLWFNLGIVGVVSSVTIFTQVVTNARKGAHVVEATLRPHLMACVFGFLGLLIALFFTELYTPWLYIWAYVGLDHARCRQCPESSRCIERQVLALVSEGTLRMHTVRYLGQPPG